MSQIDNQREYHDRFYADGSRSHIGTSDPLIDYITNWRIAEAMRRIASASEGRLDKSTPILAMCSGDGGEGSVLCDLGYTDVTVSDISGMAVKAAVERDSRLKGLVLDAQRVDLADGQFGVVLVQDGLHHLPSPIQGFTEMLRLATVGAVFLEPHDSLVGSLIGTKWERNGDAINYVFRWSHKLVESVASSYLGPDAFRNASFSFWHHNPVYARIGRLLGGGAFAFKAIRSIKAALDFCAAPAGNQFCGLVLRSQPKGEKA